MNTDKTTIDISNESLQNAALNYKNNLPEFTSEVAYAFIDGAAWQKEKDKAIIDAMKDILQDLKDGISDIHYLRKEAKQLLKSLEQDT